MRGDAFIVAEAQIAETGAKPGMLVEYVNPNNINSMPNPADWVIKPMDTTVEPVAVDSGIGDTFAAKEGSERINIVKLSTGARPIGIIGYEHTVDMFRPKNKDAEIPLGTPVTVISGKIEAHMWLKGGETVEPGDEVMAVAGGLVAKSDGSGIVVGIAGEPMSANGTTRLWVILR